MDLTTPITIWSAQTSWVELIAVAFGLLYVWYMKKASLLAFPFGIINVLIYIYICFDARLYAYATINLFYFIMSVYGWYNWTRKRDGEPALPISRCSKRSLLINILVMMLSFLILWILLSRFTDNPVPFWDALTTSVYIIGMWLTAQKKLENWIFWIAGDVISIGLFSSQGLYFSSFQFLVFTVIAILGFMEWRKKLKVITPDQV